MAQTYARGPAVVIGFVPLHQDENPLNISFNFIASTVYEKNEHYDAVRQLAAQRPDLQKTTFDFMLDKITGFQTMSVTTIGDSGTFPLPPVAEEWQDLGDSDQRLVQLSTSQAEAFTFPKAAEMPLGDVGRHAHPKTLGEFLLLGAELTEQFSGAVEFIANIVTFPENDLPMQSRSFVVTLTDNSGLHIVNHNDQTDETYGFVVRRPLMGIAPPSLN